MNWMTLLCHTAPVLRVVRSSEPTKEYHRVPGTWLFVLPDQMAQAIAREKSHG